MTQKIFNDILLGKVIEEIVGLHENSDSVKFIFDDGSYFRMFHSEDCCERVDVESISGDPEWLIGKPLIVAEAESGDTTPPIHINADSYTWTFFKFGTNNGVITIRWYGTSNGYYCEVPMFQFVQ